MELLQSSLQHLNSKQTEAVSNTQGALLILAGAGTGKTKVLTSRIAYIIEQKLAYPSNILAVTFTNKAASEMKYRVRDIIDADGLNIGTFHSIAAKILRSHIHSLNLEIDSNFVIINQDDQIKLIKDITLQNNMDIKQYPPKIIHAIISRWKDQGILFEKLSKSDLLSPNHQVAHTVYPEYQKQMCSSNVVDFGDLLLYCNQTLIQNPNILEYYQNRFKYILIDEYQDTNPAQYIWVRMLASGHKNICCVGDDDQSIYSWRGAEVRNILRFEQDFPESKIVKLEQNYRSTSVILSAASDIIQNNTNRHKKKLWTDRSRGNKIHITSCWNEKEEARFIATKIEHLIKNSKYLASQIAILVRASFQTRAFEEMFISNALPYQIIGGLRFYDRMEIRDVLAYIRLSINHDDNLALERIINVPKRSIGNVTLRKLKDYANEYGVSVFESIRCMIKAKQFTGRTREQLINFVDLLVSAGQKFSNESALDVTKFILEQSNYLGSLKSDRTEESRSRIENINEMLRAIDEFDNILEFIEHSSLVMDIELIENDFGGSVKVMTLHAAKGLEFESVFLPGWEENIFPHQKALLEKGDKGLEEERRIAYVGITRAKQDLYITYAENRRIFSEFVNSVPSRFLNEISNDLCIRSSASNRLNYMGSQHSVSLQTTRKIQDSADKKLGDKVYHAKFGAGILIKKRGDSLDIIFEKTGLKTIKENFIEKVL